MAEKADSVRMTVSEFSRKSGMAVTTIQNQMRRGVFPLGFAVRGKNRSFTYHIPREPAEYYLRTGKLPK